MDISKKNVAALEDVFIYAEAMRRVGAIAAVWAEKQKQTTAQQDAVSECDIQPVELEIA